MILIRNKKIESWFINAIDNIIVNGINKFKDGLRSDNASDGQSKTAHSPI